MNIKNMLSRQGNYNNQVIGHHSELTDEKIAHHTQQLALCAHSEISALVGATQYKHHHDYYEPKADRLTVLYETVDVVRYMMAILNIWGIQASEFEEAFNSKDVYLNYHKKMHEKQWDGKQPVIIVDIDDVLADFRTGFANWLETKMGIPVDVNTKEYYFITALSKSKHNSEAVFQMFLDQGGFSQIGIIQNNLKIIKVLKAMGCWIHLLTARPEEELQCLYDTYGWLNKYDIPADRISFSTEKFRWCAKSDYYDAGKIMFAIDDAPKHATEYAKHGMTCFVPQRPYNKHLNDESILLYDDNMIQSALRSMRDIIASKQSD